MRLFIQNKPEDFLDGTKRTVESNFLIRKLTFRSVYVLPAREVAKQFTFFTNWKEVNMTQRLHLQLSPGGMDHFCSFAVLGHCTMHLLGQLKVFNKITSFSHFGEKARNETVKKVAKTLSTFISFSYTSFHFL